VKAFVPFEKMGESQTFGRFALFSRDPSNKSDVRDTMSAKNLMRTTRTLITFYESHGGDPMHVAGLQSLLSALDRNDWIAVNEAYKPFSRPAMGSFLDTIPSKVFRDEYATEIWEALLWRWKEFMDRHLEKEPRRIRGDGSTKQ
jgi:hypothetical protein